MSQPTGEPVAPDHDATVPMEGHASASRETLIDWSGGSARDGWSRGTLASVLPSVAEGLGIGQYAGRDVFDLPVTPEQLVRIEETLQLRETVRERLMSVVPGAVG